MRKAVGGAVAGAVLLMSSGAVDAGLDDAAATAAMQKAGCSTCHGVDRKVIGPSYHDVAARHRGDKDAAASLEKIVRAGSKGAYGAIPMPPNPPSKISDPDLQALVEWILTK